MINIEFGYPEVSKEYIELFKEFSGGCYDTGSRIINIFDDGLNTENEVGNTITHEIMHYVLHKLISEEASIKYDDNDISIYVEQSIVRFK